MQPDRCDEFAEILNRHFDDVYGYVAYRVAPDSEAAKDISQEVIAFLDQWREMDGVVIAGMAGLAYDRPPDNSLDAAEGEHGHQ